MGHAYNKVAFYPLHKTCSTVKLCKYIPAVLYVIMLHKNMVSVIRHIQLSNMGLVPSGRISDIRLYFKPNKQVCAFETNKEVTKDTSVMNKKFPGAQKNFVFWKFREMVTYHYLCGTNTPQVSCTFHCRLIIHRTPISHLFVLRE